MTKRLFSAAKKRRPYRPRGYRSVFATDVDPETEEETSSEVSEEEVGLSADEFTGDLTDDPLADLADESIWAVTPGTDEDYSVTEDDFEREEAITNTSSRRVANDNLLDTLNPTGSVFVDYDPDSRASMELAPNIRPYSEVNGVDPDERMVVYRGVPPGVQTELADGDFITDMEQLAKDYAGYPYGDVISQEVFADEILDNMDEPGANEYLFRPRRASKKTASDRRTFYHLTENPNFAPDPNFRPANNTTLGGDWDPGLFVAEELEPWVNGYDYIRPWVAEMSAPADIFDRDGVKRGYSRERMIPASEYGDISVDRMIPFDAYARERFGGPGWAETFHEKTFDGAEISDWNSTWYAEGRPWGEEYRFEGDIRDWTPEQQESYSEFVKDFGRQARGLVYEGDPDWEDDEDDFYYSSKKTANEPYSVYHGTSSSAAEKIRNEGLKPPPGMGARWFMLTDSYDQAARYAPADQDPVVMEFSVSDSDIYSRGNKDSVLWQATPHSAYGFDANAYAVRGDSLPSSYLKGVHPVAGEKTSSRRVADRFQDDKYQPGTLYRGLSVDLLSDDEVNTLQDWAARNSFDPEDPDGFDFAEPNFEMIYPILERLEENGGLGRHWSKDYDVAEAFAGGWANDDPGNQGIILRVDWDGSGIDTEYDESYTNLDGSTGGVYDEEKEVNLAPGAGANLVGIDFVDLWGNKSNIPVPDIPVYASKRRAKKANSEFPALPEDFVRNISPDGFDSRWTYETTGYEPRSSDDRYDLSINPVNSPAVIPGEENGLRKKPIFYDPERTELEWDDLFGHSPTRQDQDLSHLSPPEGLLWRGMSNEEYENAKRDGYFQSKGDWNFEGQEGETYFSTDPNAAANYANDFAPIQFKPGFGNPAHVIGIPDRPELPRYEHEVGVPGQIPFSDVVQHYTGHPTAISPGSSSYFNDISTGEWSEGGGSGPSVSLAWEPGEGYKPKTSRRVAGTEDRPGNIYRGIASDFLTDDEYDQIVDWAGQNRFDRDNFQLAEPNYEMIYPILERLEGEGGLGRHWSIDYDVAEDFATQNAELYDEHHGRDEDDPDYRSPFGIVFRGDWDGEGVDYAERHQGYDGVMRPSNIPEEKEVTLHPGSEVNLLGVDIFGPEGFSYDIPVPDIKVRAHRRTPERKKDPMTAIDRYLRYASRRGMDPQSKSTLRAFARSGRGTSKTAQRDISRWFVAQKVAHDTARDVLASSRNYRRKISSSWHLDNKLSAYVSKVQQKFACSCGAKLDVPAYNICKCGKIWNAYKVHSATKGDTMYVVREVPVRENVLVANKTASRRRQASSDSYELYKDFLEYAQGQGFDLDHMQNAYDEYYKMEGTGPEADQADRDVYDFESAMYDFLDVTSVDQDDRLYDLMDAPGVYEINHPDNFRSSRRRQAYDVEEDTFDFFEKARERGYRFPKNMGDDPDSGTFQDELHNYTGGDRDRMRQVTDFARDNWGQHRHFDPYYNR